VTPASRLKGSGVGVALGSAVCGGDGVTEGLALGWLAVLLHPDATIATTPSREPCAPQARVRGSMGDLA